MYMQLNIVYNPMSFTGIRLQLCSRLTGNTYLKKLKTDSGLLRRLEKSETNFKILRGNLFIIVQVHNV